MKAYGEDFNYFNRDRILLEIPYFQRPYVWKEHEWKECN